MRPHVNWTARRMSRVVTWSLDVYASEFHGSDTSSNTGSSSNSMRNTYGGSRNMDCSNTNPEMRCRSLSIQPQHVTNTWHQSTLAAPEVRLYDSVVDGELHVVHDDAACVHLSTLRRRWCCRPALPQRWCGGQVSVDRHSGNYSGLSRHSRGSLSNQCHGPRGSNRCSNAWGWALHAGQLQLHLCALCLEASKLHAGLGRGRLCRCQRSACRPGGCWLGWHRGQGACC